MGYTLAPMTPAARRWYAVTAAVTVVYLVVALLAHPGYKLNLFGDITQQAALIAALIVIARRAFITRGRERKFWLFLSFGALLWCLAEVEWVWFEVVLRADLPDPSVGDVALFLHTVPIMGALALRPHLPQREDEPQIDTLHFLMLLVWWVFLYAFVVMAWQFASVQNIAAAGSYYSVLYFCENVLMIAAAALLWYRSHGQWRTIYAALVLSGLFYALCSVLVNRQIFLKHYYTGSYYDVPLVASILLFGSLGVLPQPSSREAPAGEGLVDMPRAWPSRLVALAVISLPLLGLWTLFLNSAPHPVVNFRLGVIMLAAVILTILIYMRQQILNRELERLLGESHQSYANLKRMQEHLVNSEKLAALGQLVAGAAHEINNPLTAILGYSELLSGDHNLPEHSRSHAEKIGHQVRRTKRLVLNMLSFAQQQPASRAPVQINSLLNNVLQLREPDLGGKKIRVNSSLDLDLPDVLGDGNHLLQVFLHIVNNAVDALTEVGGGILTVSTRLEGDKIAIEFADTGPGVKDASRIFDPFYTTKPVGKGTGLGLSVCYGIVHDHGGDIFCRNNPNGGATFLIKLPISKAAEAKPEPEPAAKAAAMAESQK